MTDLNVLTSRLDRNAPAREEDIKSFLSRVRFSPPPGYIEFMQESNGAEGPIGKSSRHLVLWPIEKLFGYNEDYHVDEFAPHLVIFGSNGAGEAYAFNTRSQPTTIVRVPFIGMDEAVAYGTRFDEFLIKLSSE